MKSILFLLFVLFTINSSTSQALRIPDDTNYSCGTSRRLGATTINIKWNSPGVKNREGKIWGTDVAHFGYQVLGFGSATESPWRAGANECTTISFDTEVLINDQKLKAGTYALFIAVYPDSCVYIFNKNIDAWGSYFYDKSQDVLRVKVQQEKNLPLKERLEFTFSNQKTSSIEVALEWEQWSIPFTVTINRNNDILNLIKSQLVGEAWF